MNIRITGKSTARATVAAIGSVLIIGGLAACGSDKAADSPAPTTTSAVAPASTTAAPASSAAPAPAAPPAATEAPKVEAPAPAPAKPAPPTLDAPGFEPRAGY
ncbi:hypothetical protein ACWCW7_15485 [Nocardia tengchongensis]